jgi:hypothetical protein
MLSLRRFRYKLARMANDFALFTTDVIYDRRHGRGAELLASFLYSELSCNCACISTNTGSFGISRWVAWLLSLVTSP